LDRKQLTDEEFTMIAMAVQKVFGMKDPYPSAMKIVKMAPNGEWLMYCLVCLDHFIYNPAPKMHLKTVKERWGFLDWMLPNMNHSIPGDAIAWDDGKEIKDWYHLICPATYGGHPDVVHVGGFINAVVAYAEHMKKGGK